MATALEIVSYDRAQHFLSVRFQTGNTYTYVNIPEDIADEFYAAPSKTAFFFERIAPNLGTTRLGTDTGRCPCGLQHFWNQQVGA